jgi:hypothetical protein
VISAERRNATWRSPAFRNRINGSAAVWRRAVDASWYLVDERAAQRSRVEFQRVKAGGYRCLSGLVRVVGVVVPSSCYGEEQEKHTRKRRADQRALKADTDCDEYEYDDQQPKSVLLSRTVYWGLHLDVKYDARWSAFVAHHATVGRACVHCRTSVSDEWSRTRLGQLAVRGGDQASPRDGFEEVCRGLFGSAASAAGSLGPLSP